MSAADTVRTRRRLIGLCAGAVAIYLAVLSGQRAIDGYQARQEVTAMAREIEALRTHNIAVQADLAAAQRDEEIERLARSELGFVRPGDHPVALLWPEGEPSPARERTVPPGRPEPRWRSWLRVFLDLE